MDTKRVSELEFWSRYIGLVKAKNNAKGHAEYKGAHTVFDGGNEAFCSYFGTDPKLGTKPAVESIKRLVAEGKLVSVPAIKGVRIYFPNEAPANYNGQQFGERGSKMLKEMGL